MPFSRLDLGGHSLPPSSCYTTASNIGDILVLLYNCQSHPLIQFIGFLALDTPLCSFATTLIAASLTITARTWPGSGSYPSHHTRKISSGTSLQWIGIAASKTNRRQTPILTQCQQHPVQSGEYRSGLHSPTSIESILPTCSRARGCWIPVYIPMPP